MPDFDLAPTITPNNPAAQRREAVSGGDLLKDKSITARKLAPDVLGDDVLYRARETGAFASQAQHDAEYKDLAESGKPDDGSEEEVALARRAHHHDYQYLDQREVKVSATEDTSGEPIEETAWGPMPPYNPSWSTRVVSWTPSRPIVGPVRIYGQYSIDGGSTWSELELVGAPPPGRTSFIYRAAGYNFNPESAVPAQDRYYVHVLGQSPTRAFRVPRSGADGKLDIGWLPAEVATNTEVTAALAAYLAAHGFTWRGAWSGATAYVAGDAVSSGGSSYVCILGHTNQTPPNVTYWNVLASKGDTGAAGSDGMDGAAGADGADGAAGAGYGGTSTSSESLAVGPRTLTIQSGKAYQAGDRVRATVTSGGAHYMEGVVTVYSGTSLTFLVDRISGTPAPYSAWNVGLAGADGADGADGSAIAVYKTTTSVKAGPSSAAEVALLTHSTTLLTDERLEIIAHGQILVNSGSTRTCTFRLKFGTTTVVTSVALSCAVSANRRAWRLRAILWGDGSSSAQEGFMEIMAQAGGTADGSSSAPSLALMCLGRGTAAESASSAKNLIISAQMSASQANVECELLAAVVTKV